MSYFLGLEYDGVFRIVLLAVRAVVGLIGLMALLSPKLFTTVAAHGGRWIDTQKLFAQLDRRYDIDHYVLPYSRVFGALVLIAVALLAFRYWVN